MYEFYLGLRGPIYACFSRRRSVLQILLANVLFVRFDISAKVSPKFSFNNIYKQITEMREEAVKTKRLQYDYDF